MPTFVDSTTVGGSGSSATINKPAGVQEGDLLIAIVHLNGPMNSSDNNGANSFTQKADISNREYNGPSAQVDFYYRVAGASEPSTYSFSFDSSNRYQIDLLAIRDYDPSIWDVEPTTTTENTGSGSSSDTDNITTITDGALVIAFAVNDSNTVSFTGTPSGFTVAENDSGNQLLATVYATKATAGAVGVLSFTQSASNGVWLNNVFAIKPASATPESANMLASLGVG